MAFHFSPKIVLNDLILYFDAANTNSYSGGTVWNDLSKEANNGIIYNGPTFNSDNNGSVFFNGTNQFVNTIRDIGFESTIASYTLDAWYKPTNLSEKFIFNRGCDNITDANVGWSMLIGLTTDGRYRTGVAGFMNSGLFGYGLEADSQAIVNKWVNITGTWEYPRTLKLYINGVLNKTHIFNNDLILRTSEFGWTLGRIRITSLYSDGYTGNVKAYRRALTDSEVLQNYNALKSRYQ